jgi:hypothetical protein
MSRLITFGCSYTYGFSLPDSGNSSSSQYSWASLLADILNLRLVNLSQSGSSNLEILTALLNYNFLPDDLVIVQWSFYNRDTVFHPTKGCIQIGPWETYEHYKEWATVHTIHDLKIKSLLSIHHAWEHLTLLGIDFKFLNIDEKYPMTKWTTDIKFLKTSFKDYENVYPKANDDVHPGVECHAKIAEEIFNEMNK